MPYRSILTYFDGDDASEDRLNAAIAVARQTDAHLTALAIGYDPNIPPYAYGEAAGAVMAELVEAAQTDAEERVEIANGMIQKAGILGDAQPLVCRYGAFSREFGDFAQYADLVVLTRPYGGDLPRTAADAFEGALFDGDSAVLVCPPGTDTVDTGTVLVAWNGSREALHAVRRSMPFLKLAGQVELLIVDPPSSERAPGEQLATKLSRHGIPVEINVQPRSPESITEVLDRRIGELGAGLLVMGGYGHSRFREYVIGGVTRDILADATVPILMAH